MKTIYFKNKSKLEIANEDYQKMIAEMTRRMAGNFITFNDATTNKAYLTIQVNEILYIK